MFFDDHKELCVPRGVTSVGRSKYLLARAAIQRHLRINLQGTYPNLGVHSFATQQDDSFREYLKTSGVYFVMCHDGANPLPLSTDTSSLWATAEEQAGIEAHETSRRIVFRRMICWLIHESYNVALINGLEWADTKVVSAIALRTSSLTCAKILSMVVEGGRRAHLGLEYENLIPRLFNTNDHMDIASLGQAVAAFELSGERKAIMRVRNCQCRSSELADNGRPFTEREMLILITLAQMLKDDPALEDLSTHFLCHTALITLLPLSNRRQPAQRSSGEEHSRLQSFLAIFSKLSSTLISSGTWAKAMDNKVAPCDISDLIDGRLFEAVSVGGSQWRYPAPLRPIFEDLAHNLCALSGIHLKIPTNLTNATSHSNGVLGLTSDAVSILPFSNPTFDKHLTSINLRVVPSKLSDPQYGRIFQEVSHWHNAKRRIDSKQAQQTPASVKDKLRSLKRDQRFMAEMQAYAASLTNAVGRTLEPEVVAVSDPRGSKPPFVKGSDGTGPSNKYQGGKTQAHRKGASKKAMLEDIAANKAVKDSESEDKVFATWRTMRINLESERSLQSKYHKISNYLRGLPRQKRRILEAEVHFHLLAILFDIYRALRGSTDVLPSKEELFGVISLLWDTIRKIAMLDSLTITIAGSLKKIIAALQLPDPGIRSVTLDRRLAYDPGLLIPKDKEFAIDMDDRDFQLLHCGPYMDRNLDSAPDSRVPFEPDGWQRQVLDDLDAKKSVFVVAPTSAGKTFISFYAMEKILRANDEDVLGAS